MQLRRIEKRNNQARGEPYEMSEDPNSRNILQDNLFNSRKKMQMNSRASRTRTLIQLGGLLDKAGLTAAFDIALGDDLQRDDHTFDPAATLLGALLEFNSQLHNKDCDLNQKRLWRFKGKKALME
jgi:hypothetical protein